jgi:hypothetical protein
MPKITLLEPVVVGQETNDSTVPSLAARRAGIRRVILPKPN